MAIQLVGVVGAGQMGAGIAQVAAHAGLQVQVVDVKEESLQLGKTRVQDSLKRLVKKASITETDVAQIESRIRWSTEIAKLGDAEFIIEAAVENESLKKSIFKQLDELSSPTTILASNTSSISITRLAAATKNPERVIGMHFMNPVPVMQLVEVIRGHLTSEATYSATIALAQSLGKTTVTSQDYPGFVANRILMPMINEAFFALMEGVASAEDIDTTMKLGCNQPMGPLALADFIGLDTCLAILEVMHDGLGDSKYRPCPLLRQYVDAGLLGKKSQRGVFDYRI